MKYCKMFREPGSEYFEISKEEARQTLEGYYNTDCLDRIFNDGLTFRLPTPFSVLWAETDDGKILIPDFYGIEKRGETDGK